MNDNASPSPPRAVATGLLALLLVLALSLQAGAARAQQEGAPAPDVPPPTVEERAADEQDAAQAADAAPQPPEEPLPLEALRTFAGVFARLKSDYVDPVEDEILIQHAIRGMIAGLDPHSAFLDNNAYAALREGTAGRFGGLGIEVGSEDGLIKVIAPIEGTPAERAGIQAGDFIVKLNGKSIRGIDLNEAVDMMRGKPGTSIILTLLRGDAQTPIELTIVREIIRIKSVKTTMLEPGFMLFRISVFQEQTRGDLAAAARRAMNGAEPLLGVILDLRNNPGGVLNAAVSVSDLFLDGGTVLYTEGRIPDSSLTFNARPGDLLNGLPMVVLINGGSASAAEIVAGALQDHKRAIIMGEQSFGKGSVQTIIAMRNNTALKLTTARYYTPQGRSIQAEGIEPDITVPNIRIAALENNGNERVVKEADLRGHLENTAPPTDNDKPAKNTATDNELALSDYQLYEALNLLKGLVRVSGNGSRP